MTFLAALRLDRVDLRWLIDGPINDERFHRYIGKVLPHVARGHFPVRGASAGVNELARVCRALSKRNGTAKHAEHLARPNGRNPT